MALIVLGLALARPALARPGPLDLARDDYRTAQDLIARSAAGGSAATDERVDQLRRAVRLLEDARNVTSKCERSEEGDYLLRLIDESLREAKRKLGVLEFRVETKPPPQVEAPREEPRPADPAPGPGATPRETAARPVGPAAPGDDSLIVAGVAVVALGVGVLVGRRLGR